MITTNYYGDVRVRLFCIMFTLSSAFTCAWRDLTIHIGNFCLLWTQLSFWNESSPSLKQKLAGVRWRVHMGKRELWHFTVLPLIPWMSHYKKPWDKPASLYNRFVLWVAKTVVDRRYSPLWEAYKKKDANRWAGVTGNALLEYKPRSIPTLTIPEQLTAKLTSAVPTTRCFVDFQLCGLPIAEGWRKSWETHGKQYPFCNISLWIDNISDIKEGKQLSSFGGELWPSAWPEYFSTPKVQHKDNQGAVYLTAKGVQLLLDAIANR